MFATNNSFYTILLVPIIVLGLLRVGSLIWDIIIIEERSNVSVSTMIESCEKQQNKDKHKEMTTLKYYVGLKGISWLMTFFNSGTTCTLFLIAGVTRTHVATNYGTEGRNILSYKYTSTSIFIDSSILS